ncbi:MgtC/SapB family protein [Scytonema hofmannii]|uniref:MgtC/SapB family protein n=1 Tax=Scytonema hofmannii TaxID=34078 RepID=UPI0030105095
MLRQQRQDFGTEEIKGLTTAASIWLAGGLGAAAGCGLWRMSLIGTLKRASGSECSQETQKV